MGGTFPESKGHIMTIDERIEKLVGRPEALTKRREALAQSVELMAHTIEDISKKTTKTLTA